MHSSIHPLKASIILSHKFGRRPLNLQQNDWKNCINLTQWSYWFGDSHPLRLPVQGSPVKVDDSAKIVLGVYFIPPCKYDITAYWHTISMKFTISCALIFCIGATQNGGFSPPMPGDASANRGLFNSNLPDPMNFVPFGTMRYSPFDINLISITCILFVYLYFCLFLNKA